MTVIHQLQNDVRYSSFDYSFESIVGYNLNVSFIPIQQVDFAAFPFSQMLEFSYRVDLCYPIGIDDFILMQPFPKEESRLSAPIKPFSYQVNLNNIDIFKGMLHIILSSIGMDSWYYLSCCIYRNDCNNSQLQPKLLRSAKAVNSNMFLK